MPGRVYVHPKPVIAVLKVLAQRMPYTRSSLPETQSKALVGLKPGDADPSPCPGERERERERKCRGSHTRIH